MPDPLAPDFVEHLSRWCAVRGRTGDQQL